MTRSPRWRLHEAATASFDAGEELEDLGLSRQFYDTQFDFPKFQADEYADKFLLGVSVRTRRPSYVSASMASSSTPSTRESASRRREALRFVTGGTEGSSRGRPSRPRVGN